MPLGFTVAELRRENGVRQMMPLEHNQELSSLRGVYGFARDLALQLAFASRNPGGLALKREQERRNIEVHKTQEGNAMVLVYVDETTTMRLGNPNGEIGSIFGFFRPG